MLKKKSVLQFCAIQLYGLVWCCWQILKSVLFKGAIAVKFGKGTLGIISDNNTHTVSIISCPVF